MPNEEHNLKRQRHERIARVKRLLRLMPRKATMHRYPVLKWFTRAARKRSYLWCFRVKAVVPAFYVGCILSLLPIYGIQLPLAVAFAFLLRANLPILATLQFITNPLTVVPAYYTAYQIGRVTLHPFGIEAPLLNMAEMKSLMDAAQSGNWEYNLQYLWTIWWVTSLGGIVLGTFLGAIGSAAYRLAAYEVVVFNEKIKSLHLRRKEH
ncbi:MAG: DUF2062 domain-containing protein [Opitutales bacterium]|jgi:uncharacterized protein (DUF2062 family)